MAEIVPGIYQLQLPLPASFLGYVNTYLIERDGGYLLVDTGWNSEEAFNSLKQQLANLQVDLREIYQIVITHIHPDHYGLAGRLKRLSYAQIYLHNLEADIIKSRYECGDKFLQQTDQWLRTNGVPPSELIEPQSWPTVAILPPLPDITLRGGETISTGTFNFQVLWTPGHSPGHISLYEPTQKILISGDHILPSVTPNVGLHPQHSSNPLDDYLNSLSVIKRLEVNLVLPGHGHPFTGLQQRVEEIIQHHKQRNSEILEIMKAKPKTAYQISVKMTWLPDINTVSWQSLSPWDKRLAVLETVAHLESMRFGGKLGRFFKDNTIYYHSI